MRILMVGDVVGKPGRRILGNQLKRFRLARGVDFIVVNGENASGGSGINITIARKFLKYGVDVITHGDHAIKKEENKPALEKYHQLIRPMNYEQLPGVGFIVTQIPGKSPVAVLNVIGRVFLDKTVPNPFKTVEAALAQVPPEVKIRLIDFHAEATAEKIAMGWFLDGRVTAVVGTHTHVMTADETILPKGTAYITDLGMTGPHQSVIGRKVENVLPYFVEEKLQPFHVADGDVRINGLLIDADEQTGLATAVERVTIHEDDVIELPAHLAAQAAADDVEDGSAS